MAWEVSPQPAAPARTWLSAGKFSRAYDGYNKPFETYFVATGLVPEPRFPSTHDPNQTANEAWSHLPSLRAGSECRRCPRQMSFGLRT